LFVNNIGRPDLKEKTQELTSKLDASIKGKISRLPDETNILPAHHVKPIEADTFIEAKLKDIKSLQNLQQIFGLQTSFFIAFERKGDTRSYSLSHYLLYKEYCNLSFDTAYDESLLISWSLSS
jgi:hypothetical protein